MGEWRRDEYRRSRDAVPYPSSDDSSVRLGSSDAPRPAGIHSAPLGGSHSGAPPTTHARLTAPEVSGGSREFAGPSMWNARLDECRFGLRRARRAELG